MLSRNFTRFGLFSPPGLVGYINPPRLLTFFSRGFALPTNVGDIDKINKNRADVLKEMNEKTEEQKKLDFIAADIAVKNAKLREAHFHVPGKPENKCEILHYKITFPWFL